MDARRNRPADGRITLSTLQRDALRILQELSDEGAGVTVGTLARELACARSNEHRLLDQLEDRGWIRRERGRVAGIVILHRVRMPDFDALDAVPLQLRPAAYPVARAPRVGVVS